MFPRLMVVTLLCAATAVAQTTSTGLFRPPANPVRLGEVALKLSDKDVRAILSAVPGGDKPWLLYGVKNPVVAGLPRAVIAYLPPSTSTPTLIRGVAIGIVQTKSRKWEAYREQSHYAQIAPTGAAFENLQWDDIFNRPFWVRGAFDDDELLQLIALLRKKQESRVPDDLSLGISSRVPLRSIKRINQDEVWVTFSDDDFSGQDFSLRRQGESWAITPKWYWVN